MTGLGRVITVIYAPDSVLRPTDAVAASVNSSTDPGGAVSEFVKAVPVRARTFDDDAMAVVKDLFRANRLSVGLVLPPCRDNPAHQAGDRHWQGRRHHPARCANPERMRMASPHLHCSASPGWELEGTTNRRCHKGGRFASAPL